MIEVMGSREEIAAAVKGIAPDWPVEKILCLAVGEWSFTLNGIDTRVYITEDLRTMKYLVCSGKTVEVRQNAQIIIPRRKR